MPVRNILAHYHSGVVLRIPELSLYLDCRSSVERRLEKIQLANRGE